MKIITFGKGERLRYCAELLKCDTVLSRYSELVILPIPTTVDGVHINATNTRFDELCGTVSEGSFVLGYGIPESAVVRLEDAGATVCDALGDEIFLEKNAELTALGTLGVLLTSAGRGISELSVGVVGYGRIGRHLIRILLFLGAKVRVYTRKPSTRLELCSLGIDASLSSGGDYTGLDYLINTAPDRVLTDGETKTVTAHGEIIDLASGVNFPSDLPITKLGGIPGLMYPASAGRIYAEAALRYEGGDGGC